MYQLWPGQAQFMPILTFIWPPWPWPSTYVKKMFQLASFFLRDNNCAKIILKSMHKCTSYGPDKFGRTNGRTDWRTYTQLKSQYMSILTFIWPLLPWPSTYLKKCFKLHFSSSRTTTVQNYFWNLLQVNNCAKLFWYPCIIVQVMLRTSSIHVFDHFDLYLTPVTLNFNLLKMFWMVLFLFKGNNCAKLYWNPCIIVQVMVRTNSDERTDALTDARTPN